MYYSVHALVLFSVWSFKKKKKEKKEEGLDYSSWRHLWPLCECVAVCKGAVVMNLIVFSSP